LVGPLKTFVAVGPPEEVRHALVDQISSLQIPGRLVPPANWHITLRFLGDIDEVTFERYLGALDQVDLGTTFRVALYGFGAFPNQRKATVVWAAIRDVEGRLHALAEMCDEAAAVAGLAREERPFSPHLTLSRVRPPSDVVSLVSDGELDMSWRVGEVVVFQSLSTRGGVRYEALETFSLLR
jgi:RNA 2',3'-cyclic 3'-phosphodiesterase